MPKTAKLKLASMSCIYVFICESVRWTELAVRRVKSECSHAESLSIIESIIKCPRLYLYLKNILKGYLTPHYCMVLELTYVNGICDLTLPSMVNGIWQDISVWFSTWVNGIWLICIYTYPSLHCLHT